MKKVLLACMLALLASPVWADNGGIVQKASSNVGTTEGSIVTVTLPSVKKGDQIVVAAWLVDTGDNSARIDYVADDNNGSGYPKIIENSSSGHGYGGLDAAIFQLTGVNNGSTTIRLWVRGNAPVNPRFGFTAYEVLSGLSKADSTSGNGGPNTTNDVDAGPITTKKQSLLFAVAVAVGHANNPLLAGSSWTLDYNASLLAGDETNHVLPAVQSQFVNKASLVEAVFQPTYDALADGGPHSGGPQYAYSDWTAVAIDPSKHAN